MPPPSPSPSADPELGCENPSGRSHWRCTRRLARRWRRRSAHQCRDREPTRAAGCWRRHAYGGRTVSTSDPGSFYRGVVGPRLFGGLATTADRRRFSRRSPASPRHRTAVVPGASSRAGDLGTGKGRRSGLMCPRWRFPALALPAGAAVCGTGAGNGNPSRPAGKSGTGLPGSLTWRVGTPTAA